MSKKTDDSGSVALTTDEREQLEKDAVQTYGVTSNKMPFGITGMPVDFVRTAMSIDELKPFDETLADAIAIYKCLRVPRHLVPDSKNSTFDNADADLKSFYSDVIIPWAKRLAYLFTTGMKFNEVRRYVHADFSHVNVLQENKKEKADVDKVNGEVWKTRYEGGACSLNEWIMSFEGTKGVGPIYEKKIFELTPEEKDQMELIRKGKTAVDMEKQSQIQKTVVK